MGDGIKLYHSEKDGCIYFFDKKEKCYKKVCKTSFDNLPYDVKEQIYKDKEEAELILAQPTK